MRCFLNEKKSRFIFKYGNKIFYHEAPSTAQCDKIAMILRITYESFIRGPRG